MPHHNFYICKGCVGNWKMGCEIEKCTVKQVVNPNVAHSAER